MEEFLTVEELEYSDYSDFDIDNYSINEMGEC